MTEKYDEIMIEDLNVSGMVMDRDLNAAINIMAAGSAPEAENGCGEDVRPSSSADLCEASTRQSLELPLATGA